MKWIQRNIITAVVAHARGSLKMSKSSEIDEVPTALHSMAVCHAIEQPLWNNCFY
jgi:hypothetical protein